MTRDGMADGRRYFKVGPVWLDKVGSWDHPRYRLFGAWRHHHGFTLRFRGWLLVVCP